MQAQVEIINFIAYLDISINTAGGEESGVAAVLDGGDGLGVMLVQAWADKAATGGQVDHAHCSACCPCQQVVSRRVHANARHWLRILDGATRNGI